MNTEILTTPSPELKQHAQDLRRNAEVVAKDIKNQASAGLNEIKTEANARYQDAQGKASDFYQTTRDLAADHPVATFGAGILAGIILTALARR